MSVDGEVSDEYDVSGRGTSPLVGASDTGRERVKTSERRPTRVTVGATARVAEGPN